MKLGAYFRTARRTHWSQLLWRARYGLERRWRMNPRTTGNWSWPGTVEPPLTPAFPEVPLFHRSVPSGTAALAALQAGVFEHLNVAHALGRAEPDWRLGPITTDRLWTITLHYHAWAYELATVAAAGGPDAEAAAELFRHYVSDWMKRCSLAAPGARNLAWNAYAIATRISWWIRSYQLLSAERFGAWKSFWPEFLRSLWQQAAYLHDHVEWDLLANHLLRDAVGLAWAGRFFQGERADQWLVQATRIAREQAREQVLPDGGHFERSPMYHLQIMDDLLSLVLLIEDPAVQAELRATWYRMAEYAMWLRHPDGRIPLLNDAALDADSEPARRIQVGERLGVQVRRESTRGGRYFADSGLAVWHGEAWAVFFDVGSVGPDYQPGHAHADTLTVECSYHGERLFVDPGTFGYDLDERRRYDRSTAAHNTVCIDGQDSSEVWHIFRMGRRAYPVDVHVDCSPDGLKASASHTGYDHLPGTPRHSREITVSDDGPFVLRDRIGGQGRHVVSGGYLLAPRWTAEQFDGGWTIRSGSNVLRLQVAGPRGIVLAVERRPYHPEFGRELSTSRLVWKLDAALPVVVTVQVEPA